MRKIVILLTAAILSVSCTSLRPEYIEIVSLGIADDDISVSSASGEDGVAVISDREYEAKVISGAEWLRIGIAAADTLSFSFDANNGFRRSGVISVSADGREDLLTVKQEGTFQERLALSQSTVDAPVEGCNVIIRILSNLPSDYLKADSSLSSAIDNLKIDSYILSFRVLPTTNRDKRTYTVTVSYTDGWGEVLQESVAVTQEAYE